MNDTERAMNEEGRSIWDQKADFWDNLHGDEGNDFHRILISPAVERLLALQPGERLLDIACGNGTLARRMAELGGRVTAVDFSEALLEKARSRGQDSGEPIHYAVADATNEEALAALGQFDAVTCTMALMDMPVIAPLYRALRHLLVAEGRFVFAIPHPFFNSTAPTLSVERRHLDGKMSISRSLSIYAYLNIPPYKSEGAPDDLVPHTYYHRPLQQILGEAFAAGLVLDGLEEPSFTAEHAEAERPLAWQNFHQFSPIMAARLRPANRGLT